MNKKEKIEKLNIIRTSLMNCGGCEGSRKPWYVLDEIIKELKTPIQKGDWTQKYHNDGGWHSPDYWDHMYKCSNCGSDGSNRFNFCPKCGLPMNDKALEILAKRSERGDNEGNE